MLVPTIGQVRAALVEGRWDVVVPPPGSGPGFWAGGPSAVHADGRYLLAYRLRRPVDQGRGYANVVAESADGVDVRPVAVVTADELGCASLERPALVRRADGGWRLYVSCSTANSKHWWVEAIDTGPGEGPQALAGGRRTVVLPGDRDTAWKDVVVHRDGEAWTMWACRHPLDGGDDQADRMETWYATSRDGLDWTWQGPALRPAPGSWNARGTRLTSVWTDGSQWLATFDGRASAAENWFEKTGVALGPAPSALAPAGDPLLRSGRGFRYVSLVRADTGWRLFLEAPRSDGANELCTVWLPDPGADPSGPALPGPGSTRS